jgi:hypothetical protein
MYNVVIYLECTNISVVLHNGDIRGQSLGSWIKTLEILYVIQLSDRVYNVTFPAYDICTNISVILHV